MAVRHSKGFWREHWGPILSVAIYIVTFILDCYTPLGFVDWFFYFIPVLLNIPIPLSRFFWFPSVAAVLIILGLFLSSPGVPISFAVFERFGAIIMLWLAAVLSKRRRGIEEKYREVVETADSIILRWGMDRKITYINSYGSRFFGYAADELIGKPVDLLVPPTESTGRDLRGLLQDITSNPETYTRNENENLRRDGSRAWVFWSNRILRDEWNKPREVLAVGSDITAHKQAEDALRYTKEHLSLALEAGNEGTFEYDLRSGEIFLDVGSRKIFGIPNQESLPYDRFLAIVYLDDRPRVDAAVKKSVFSPSAASSGLEFRIVRPDGEVRWINIRGRVYFIEQGAQRRAVKFIGTNADITERKRAEDASQASEQRYHTLFESMGEGFAVCEMIYDAAGKAVDFRYARVNHAFAKLIELAYERIEGRTARELIPDLAPSWVETYERVVKSGRSERFENRIQVLDRHYVAYAWRSGPGQFAVVFNDITELKHKEDALRKSREQLQYAFEQYQMALASANQGTVIYYPQSGGIMLDGRSRALFGLGEGAFSIERIYGVLDPEERERIKEEIAQAVSPPFGKVVDLEFKILHPEGHYRWISMRGKTYVSEGVEEETTVRFAGIAMDITKRKEAEEILKRDRDLLDNLVTERSYKLLEAQKELDRSRRLSDMGTLAATVAHELRNPLAFIKLAGSNIRRRANDPVIEEKINSIDEKIDDGNKIIDDLLFYARLRPPRFEKIKVYALLREIVDTSMVRYAGRNMKLSLETGGVMAETVEADLVQLKEILENLVNNAVEAIPVSLKGEIHVSASRDDGYIEIRVQDNGTGIKSEDLDRVFEPFFTTKRGGTGLGLSVVKQIVEMHNGSIRMQSAVGRGTTAIMRLPHEQKRA